MSWKTLAAHRAGMRMRRPRPSTLVWRSFVDVLLGGGFLAWSEEIWMAEEVVVCRVPVVSTAVMANDW